MAKQTDQIPAKMCYSHIGGKLGTLLMETFMDKGWLQKGADDDKHFQVTPKGEREFRKIGVDISQIKTEKL
jgi:hypothetical protein